MKAKHFSIISMLIVMGISFVSQAEDKKTPAPFDRIKEYALRGPISENGMHYYQSDGTIETEHYEFGFAYSPGTGRIGICEKQGPMMTCLVYDSEDDSYFYLCPLCVNYHEGEAEDILKAAKEMMKRLGKLRRPLRSTK